MRLLKLGRSMLAQLLFLYSVGVNCLTRVEVQGRPDLVHDWTQELDSYFSNQNANNQAFSFESTGVFFSAKKDVILFRSEPSSKVYLMLPRSCSRAMKAVGVMKASCEEIFELVMSMDGTRYEWDCSLLYRSLVEEVDGHTAILYHRLQLDWLPILMLTCSSRVANGVLGLVIGVITALVVDMAFLVQANTTDELPERLIGAVRVSYIELKSAIVPKLEPETS
ncbi:hypothetical protein KPL71_014939 [Citrus sinensis]|uniref:Uncharacterized protein n=1 Tax=Citrus sinensis TaxID=2711 RepID=A0ACB8KF37_CITSI|nr:hypothetical protein KPL71_014939 [Citrus sinensis]